MAYLNSVKTLALGGVSWMAACAAPIAAQPQRAPPPHPAETAGDDGAASSTDIIVTAQRRAESAQDIPIAITAFSQESLQSQRIETGAELVRGIPNVNFSKGFFGFNFQIRGVGTQLGAVSGDAGVALHINNVPLSISRFFEAQFFDVERVEVLRGPQGTLYGRNATGGV